MVISVIDNDVLIDGVSTAQLAGTLKKAGIAEHKIGQLIGYWYVGAVGDTRPAPFDFSTDVQTRDADCEVTYARTFEHVDWVDGEDRVQAGATPEELGFNARFHGIEAEFDAVADQLRGLGRCATDLRADLVGVVRELESKITALQNQIHDLRPKPEPSGGGLGILGTVKVADKFAYIAKYGNEFQLVEFAGATIGGSPRGPREPLRPEGFRPEDFRVNDLVHVATDVEDVLVTPGFAKLFEGPGEVSVADIRTAAGGLVLDHGAPLAAVIAAMPADQKFASAAEATQAITGHVVSLVPEATAREVKAALITDVTLRDADAGAVGAATATAVGADHTTVTILADAGVDTTVAGLSAVTSTDLARRLAETDISVSSGALRDAVALSRLAGALGGRFG